MTTISHPELEGLDRYRFGWADPDTAGASARRGLSEAVVRDISAKKNEPGTRLARAGKREFPEASGCL
jgi:Fe-S cluster assembly protein SufB